jgi:hypothetical protein
MIDLGLKEYRVMSKLLDRIRDMTGVYASGFNPASAAGFLLPGLFVIVVGGGLAAWIILR